MRNKTSDELYVATATPIVTRYGYGFDNFEKEVDTFLVKPIIKKTLFGDYNIVGYVEAVSNVKIIDTKEFRDPITRKIEIINYDEKTRSVDIGNVDWHVNLFYKAHQLLSNEEIKKYMSCNSYEILKRIDEVREFCSDIIKENSLEKAMRK